MKKVILLLAFFLSITSFAKEGPWIEMQCIDIPQNALLQEGKTESGNAKYWFEFDQIGKVSVSPGSAEKFKSGEATLQLVKWRHKENGKYKYSIRQRKGSKRSLNIDLLTIFK